MALERGQVGGLGLLDEGVVQLGIGEREGDVHPGARRRLDRVLEEARIVDRLVEELGLAGVDLGDKLHRNAALGVLAEAKAAAPELACLCHDERDLVDMQPDHLQLLLDNRLAKHRAAEYARQEAERERIRAEERAKAEREAREQVEAEHRAESARKQAEEQANSRLLAKPDPDDSDMQQIHRANSEAVYVPLLFTGDHQRRELLAEQKRAAAYQDAALIFAESEFMKSQAAYGPKTEAANTPATTAPATGPMLKLGEINARLAPISISADGLARLGFTPDPAVKTAKLYRAADLPLILAAMVRHIKGVGVDLLQAA